MQPLIELTYRGQIRRLRGLARAALPIWGLRDAEIRYLYHGENTTFRIDHGSDRFMMRLARPGYHTPQQLDSEGQWLRSQYGAGFGVPEPIAHPNGYLLPLAAPGVPERQVLLFRWVDGCFARKWRQSCGGLTGRLLAELHAHARTFEPGANFSRVVWNSETLLTAEHGRFLSWRHADLDPALHPFLEDVNAALLESVRALERTGPRWLLHADLHRGNVLFLPNTANAIDFDDCGFGHPAVDIAVALGSPWADNYDAAWNALCAGYPEVTSELPFTREQVRLQCLTRTLQMIGWLADRGRDMPGLAKYAPKRLEIAIPHYRAWMKELGG